jgi:hypothetical protein
VGSLSDVMIESPRRNAMGAYVLIEDPPDLVGIVTEESTVHTTTIQFMHSTGSTTALNLSTVTYAYTV